jgi:hypothetical protein
MSQLRVSEQVARYISQNPTIRAALNRGIVNYSALAREICGELNIPNFAAVVAALQRRSQRIDRRTKTARNDVVRLLQRANLTIRSRLAVGVIDKPKAFTALHDLQSRVHDARGHFQYIEGSDAVVVILNREHVPALETRFRGRVLSLREDLAQIHLRFDSKIETTVGVGAFVYGLLADRDINILEEFSCWTDMMLMVNERDLPATLNVLSLG